MSARRNPGTPGHLEKNVEIVNSESFSRRNRDIWPFIGHEDEVPTLTSFPKSTTVYSSAAQLVFIVKSAIDSSVQLIVTTAQTSWPRFRLQDLDSLVLPSWIFFFHIEYKKC